jgi:radical SAM superfamily enzyme YgiQ (UPF0313 family)
MIFNNIYWMLFSVNISNILTKRYDKAYTKTVMPKIKQQYRTLLKRFPDVGKHTLIDMVNMESYFLLYGLVQIKDSQRKNWLRYAERH